MMAVRTAYRELQNRISIFVNFPLESLDKLKLQKRLDAIGRSTLAEDTAEAPAQ